METRQVIIYIAMNLDGYIASDNNDIDFMSLVESPPEDYGYASFISTIDTVIMGRKAYDKVLGFGIEFPHKDKKCYVLSRNKKGMNKYVEFFNGDIAALISLIRAREGKDIFCDGGSEIIFELMQKKLVEDMSFL